MSGSYNVPGGAAANVQGDSEGAKQSGLTPLVIDTHGSSVSLLETFKKLTIIL